MAGHSKWANIRYRKSVQDAKRGKLFTKIIREIAIAARTGGGDPKQNPRLRAVIDKALDANMTREVIERAVKRGTGELEGAHYEEVRYEGYGHGGAAVMIECQTDNRTRTVGEVRHALTKHGGHLGTEGSVAYLFHKRGVLSYAPGTSEDRIMEAALEAGADDVVTGADGSIEVFTAPEQFVAVTEGLAKAGLKPDHAEVVQRAAIDVALEGDDARKMWELIEALEDLDDVQHVYSNAHFSDAFMQQHAAGLHGQHN
ncbi:MAG: YebC/PmpR family DNA-binding transcriptional regulator [Gammaproteobacteria bacterium]|nr:YebC/PmpR family DNA-binding transcriptional regulator [Gammaproteobacteria bacterium]